MTQEEKQIIEDYFHECEYIIGQDEIGLLLDKINNLLKSRQEKMIEEKKGEIEEIDNKVYLNKENIPYPDPDGGYQMTFNRLAEMINKNTDKINELVRVVNKLNN